MNDHLRAQNSLLRAQNRAMMQAMASRSNNRAIMSPENVNDLQLENALLRSERDTLVCFIARVILCRSIFAPTASTSTWLFQAAVMIELAVREVLSLARHEIPMQTNNMWTNSNKLNLSGYYSNFFPWYARNAPGFVHEASRASSDLVHVEASTLVTTLMDIERWPEIFPSIVAGAATELHHRRFQTINMDFMPLISPSTETRNVKLLRCSKLIENNMWVIADISVYFTSYEQHLRPKFMRFPSGYLVERIANGRSRVTVIDHWVYKEEEGIHFFDPNSGFGAHRWLAALHRHYSSDCFNLSLSMGHHIQMFDPVCHTNLLNLARRMVYLFWTGVFGMTRQGWRWVRTVQNPINRFRMCTQESRDMNGVPCILVSATGMGRMLVRMETIFDLINNETLEKKEIWEYLEPYGEVKELVRLIRGRSPGNIVSLFSIKERTGSKESVFIQETYYDSSSAMIIHSCLEASSLAAVFISGDISNAHLLPCGITITRGNEAQGHLLCANYQVITNQPAAASSVEMVTSLQKLIDNTLRNVRMRHSLSLPS
ncbi:unnamed protein product [Microthlaspi erraticum]|uniref:START domain-containing protein n=1 Tax=Microthlaspi erraticum TaxID=1685480 RepID=A0A6D2IMR6_9BRAS|nr:unnamed protein product [Microthlaspi erraticum]